MRNKRFLKGILRFLAFFLPVSLLTTFTILTFMNTLMVSIGHEYTEQEINLAARLTFLVVVLIAFAFSLTDYFRMKIYMERPCRKIKDVLSKYMSGDFSVSVSINSHLPGLDQFASIAEDVNRLRKELSGVETLRNDFISNVSHELKTPLSVIQNYGMLLSAPDLDEKQRMEYASIVTAKSRELANLVTNILRLNKLENQQILPKAEEFSLSDSICSSLLQFEGVWEQKGIILETDIEEDIAVRSDRELLSLIWSNLFSNAFKFTPEGGTVAVSLHRADGYAVLNVQDTGIGIPEDVRKHVWEKFYQGDRSHSTAGNGLGLALVRRCAVLTGAEVFFESEVGRGTLFTVRIRL